VLVARNILASTNLFVYTCTYVYIGRLTCVTSDSRRDDISTDCCCGNENEDGVSPTAHDPWSRRSDVGLAVRLVLPVLVNCWTMRRIINTSELILLSRTASCLQGDQTITTATISIISIISIIIIILFYLPFPKHKSA